MRHVLYDPTTGVIRAVIRNSKSLAQRNLRPGEAMLSCPTQFISSQQHCIVNGVVQPKPAAATVVEIVEDILDKIKKPK